MPPSARIRTRFGPMLWRGLLRRCPRCGSFQAWFRGWWSMEPRCRSCGYGYERQPGFSLGAATINIIVTFGLIAVVLVVGVVASYPHVAVVPILAVALPIALVVPIVLYPVSYTVWAAVDLAMRPMEPHEIAEASAALAAARVDPAAVSPEDA
jgi:uncharacterized protein (DUF983 family)